MKDDGWLAWGVCILTAMMTGSAVVVLTVDATSVETSVPRTLLDMALIPVEGFLAVAFTLRAMDIAERIVLKKAGRRLP